jgi:hypothetical protein
VIFEDIRSHTATYIANISIPPLDFGDFYSWRRALFNLLFPIINGVFVNKKCARNGEHKQQKFSDTSQFSWMADISNHLA